MLKKLLIVKEFPLIATAIGILALLGIILAWRSLAGQLPYVNVQPEAGSLSGQVKVASDSTATGSGYLVFGVSPSTATVNTSDSDPVIAAAGSIGQAGGAAGSTSQLICRMG